MEYKDTQFNSKIVYAGLGAVIIAVLIAFYFSYAQSSNEISFLEQEKEILVKDLTMMKAEVDRLSALNEVNEIELQDSRYRVQSLLDSVGKLNFTVSKLRAFKKELRKLELRHDSLKSKSNFLTSNNKVLEEKYGDTQNRIADLKNKSAALAEAEAQLREKNKELSHELKIKNYLNLANVESSGFRLRSNGKPIRSTKASMVEKIRGCFTLKENPSVSETLQKVIYFQVLSPAMQIIEDNASTVSVNGNSYSKRIELAYNGEMLSACDYISVPKGSLKEGIYTLNIFEDEKLLSSSEFTLK